MAIYTIDGKNEAYPTLTLSSHIRETNLHLKNDNIVTVGFKKEQFKYTEEPLQLSIAG